MFAISGRKVFLYFMLLLGANTAVIQSEARRMIKRQVSEWFDFIDSILEFHCANYVLREPKADMLGVHKEALKLAIRTCNQVNLIVGDPDFNEPELVVRLKVRLQQLQDAFDTFHDPGLSDERAGRILSDVFPE